MDYKNINIKDIKADDNIRKSIAKESLEGLMQSIKEQGIIQPLVVRKLKDNTFDLIAGFRRLMAAKELNLSNVPCVIRAAENDEIVELQLIENIQRENLNPIDEAKAIQELAKDHTVADLIPMLGKNELYITRQLVLLTLPKAVQKAIADKKLSRAHGVVIARLQKSRAQISLFKEIMSERLSVSQAEARVEDYSSNLEYAPFDKTDCKTCPHAGINQKDFFDSDISLKGKCLNPSCYESKLKQHVIQRKEFWKEKGIAIIPREVYRKESNRWRCLSGYMTESITKEDIAKEVEEKKNIAVSFRDNGSEEMLIDEKTYMRLARKKKAEEKAGTKSDGSRADFLEKRKKENRIETTKRRFLLARLQTKPSSNQLDRIILDKLFHTFSSTGFEISELLKEEGIISKRTENYNVRYNLISTLKKVKPDVVNKLISSVARKKISEYDTSDVEDMAGEVNVNMSQFRIDEDYLNAFTKNGLMKLIKEFGLKPEKDIDSKKKTEIISWILGKNIKQVPKELMSKKK